MLTNGESLKIVVFLQQFVYLINFSLSSFAIFYNFNVFFGSKNYKYEVPAEQNSLPKKI